MTTLLAELLKTKTEEEALAFVIEKLQSKDVPTTSWHTGSWGDIVAHVEAEYAAEIDATIANIAMGGFLDLAATITPEGGPGWLDLLAEGFFQEKRQPAVATRGDVRMATPIGVGPYIRPAGAITVSDASRAFAFRNVEEAHIPYGGTAPVSFQAVKPGAAFNLSNGGITVLQTSLPGVTIATPAIAGTSSWISRQGTDVESNALLVARCKNKWGTIGSGSNDASYLYYATSASPEVTRTRIVSDPTTGIVKVVVAGPSGPLTSDAFAKVVARLAGKSPLTVRVVAVNALPSNTAIAGAIKVSGAYDLGATLAAAQASVLAFGRAQDIGQTLILEKLQAAIVDTPGVLDLSMTAPLINTSLGSTTVFTPNFLLTATR